MTKLEQLLENALMAQVNLEEGLINQVSSQLSQDTIDEHPEIKGVLKNIKSVLEVHFARLNLELDNLNDSQMQIKFRSTDPEWDKFERTRIITQMLIR